MVAIFPEKTVMTCYSIDKQWIMVMKTGDLSDKRAFLSDNSKNNSVLLLCYSRVFITFATGYCFLRENGNHTVVFSLFRAEENTGKQPRLPHQVSSRFMKTRNELKQPVATGTFFRMACNYRICRGTARFWRTRRIALE